MAEADKYEGECVRCVNVKRERERENWEIWHLSASRECQTVLVVPLALNGAVGQF